MLKLKYGEKFTEPCALLLGGFDGLHRGHKSLIDEAKKTGLFVGLTTIYGAKTGGNVFTAEERAEIFARAGVDFVIEADFPAVKDISATYFLSSIFSSVRAEAVFCGEDFRFGKGAAAGAAFLREAAPCPVRVLPISSEGGEKFAISAVKERLSRGDVAGANKLLVFDYFVRGVVEHGRQVGRTYGFPTANLSFPSGKFPLREGVYRGYVETEAGTYPSIVNFGARPTFGVEQKKTEAYLQGFHGDLYGKIIRVFPTAFIRPIVRFSSPEELKIQLKKDLERLR